MRKHRRIIGITCIAVAIWVFVSREIGESPLQQLLLGYLTGVGLGIAIGRKQKPWSELNEREKKIRIAVTAAPPVLALAITILFFVRLYS